MGVDIGFDIFPPFEDTDEDNKAWAAFLADVVVTFAHDPNLVDDTAKSYIYFNIGECPRLERDASCFLRFSSKMTSRDGDAVISCIRDVRAIARRHFGSDCVHGWSDNDRIQDTKYEWTEVFAAYKRGEAKYRAQRLAQKDTEPTPTDSDGGPVPA
ncbi:hypothetical protein M0805_001445 [Coniferiporia weirii]|nr:hypothetical protein M0805_001445 [Coniferiporia weirii]